MKRLQDTAGYWTETRLPMQWSLDRDLTFSSKFSNTVCSIRFLLFPMGINTKIQRVWVCFPFKHTQFEWILQSNKVNLKSCIVPSCPCAHWLLPSAWPARSSTRLKIKANWTRWKSWTRKPPCSSSTIPPMRNHWSWCRLSIRSTTNWAVAGWLCSKLTPRTSR